MSQPTPELISLAEALTSEVSFFEGGRLAKYYEVWQTLTSDPEILDIVKGLHLEFVCPLSRLQNQHPAQPHLSDSEMGVIDAEIQKLKDKRVLIECDQTEDQFLSPVFTRPNRDGSHRMILNLKCLNKNITYHHFKMDTLATALDLVTPGCYFASVDLKDAYYTCSVAKAHRKFLRFQWKGQTLEFTCMPNGLAIAPRKFTKLLKPVFATLREKGHLSSAYLDDSVLLAQTREECLRNVVDTVQLFRSLGFIVHPVKLVLEPSQTIQYLGVIIDSRTMTVRLTDERAKNLQTSCQKLLKQKTSTIWEVAIVIGKIVASFPAVRFGALHYRQLEEEKKAALLRSRWDYDGFMTLSPSAEPELTWWIENIATADNDISPPDPDLTLTYDACKTGWGCSYGDVRSGGHWLSAESSFHINYLELKAAFLALQGFRDQVRGKRSFAGG